MIKVIFFVILGFSSNVFAYPNFILHGYNTCLTCHYNPMGNGPLNDYGRSLSAVLISDRILHDKNISDESLGEKSGFMYTKDLHESIKPSIDYRGLYLDRDVDKNDKKSEFINMQADFNLVVLFNKANTFFTSLSYGYAPKPRSLDGEDIETYRSREHYLGYRPNENLSFYFGMLDKTFGLKIPDHIAFSKSTTYLAENDQTHGLLIHYQNELVEIGLHPFLGNQSQKEEIRQKGISNKTEFKINDYFKPGFSLLKSESDFQSSELYSMHFKFATPKTTSFMFEFGKHTKEDLVNKIKTDQEFLFIQNHILISRGQYLLLTTEYFNPNTDNDIKIIRLGPGFQYFLNQGIELRSDLYNTKSFNPDSSSLDSWDFTAQVHLWF